MKKIFSIISVSFALVFSSSAFANKIGVVYDSGGKFDKSFNELAYESALRVQNELGWDMVEFEGSVSDANHGNTELTVSWRSSNNDFCTDLIPEDDGTTSCEALIGIDDTDIVLEVKDPEGAAAIDSISVLVLPTEAPTLEITSPSPSAKYYSDQLITFSGTIADEEDASEDLIAVWESNLDGELSTIDTEADSSGEILGSGYLTEGEHAIKLTVTDTSGKDSSGSVTITVGPPNSAPACSITAPQNGDANAEGELVIFEANATDADISSSDLLISWASDKDGDIGTSTADSAGNVSFAYTDLSVNTHTITMTVADELGETCVANVIYTVGTPPTISIDNPINGETYDEGEILTFTATVDDNEDQPNNIALSWYSDLDGEISTQSATSSGLGSRRARAWTARFRF